MTCPPIGAILEVQESQRHSAAELISSSVAVSPTLRRQWEVSQELHDAWVNEALISSQLVCGGMAGTGRRILIRLPVL